MFGVRHHIGCSPCISIPGRSQRLAVRCQYEMERPPGRPTPGPPPPPPPPPPREGFNMADRRALLISLGGLGLGVAAASKLVSGNSTSSSARRRKATKDDPWRAPIIEAMQSDVVEDEGEIVVRMSTGNWYYLREDPADSKAFILEGGFGERFRLQTDKPVRSFSMDMLHRIFSRHDLWERRLVRLQ